MPVRNDWGNRGEIADNTGITHRFGSVRWNIRHRMSRECCGIVTTAIPGCDARFAFERDLGEGPRMGWRTTACTLLLSLLGSGCAVVTDSAHATSYWTNQSIKDMQERHRNRKLAASAWEESRAANPSASEDFAEGFQDGFADHLYRATSQPPPLPPKRYREIRYQTSVGFRAAEEWLEGFRLGIDEAQASGLRELVTGPSSIHGSSGVASVQQAAIAKSVLTAPMIPPSDRLPNPRSIEPSMPPIVRPSLALPPTPSIPTPLPADPSRSEIKAALEPVEAPRSLPVSRRTSEGRFALPEYCSGRYTGPTTCLLVSAPPPPQYPSIVLASHESRMEPKQLSQPLVLSVSPALSLVRGEKPWWIAKAREPAVVEWRRASATQPTPASALWAPLVRPATIALERDDPPRFTASGPELGEER